MSFSLSLFEPENPSLIDAALLAAGKALYIANAFESKCSFVLGYFRLVGFCEANPKGDHADALAVAVKKMMLARTINEMKLFPIVTEADAKALEAAKDARNFIAHEGGAGYLWSVSERGIYQHLERLRTEVFLLAEGDYIASTWAYYIEEKGAYGHSITNYPERIDSWIFGWWDGIVPPEPPRISGSEKLRRALGIPPSG